MRFLLLTSNHCPSVSFFAVAIWLYRVNIAYCSEQLGPSGNSQLSDTTRRESSSGRGASSPKIWKHYQVPARPSPAEKLLVQMALKKLNPQDRYTLKKETLKLAIGEIGSLAVLVPLYKTYKLLGRLSAARGENASDVSQHLHDSLAQRGLLHLLESLLLLDENPPHESPLMPTTVESTRNRMARLEQVLENGITPDDPSDSGAKGRSPSNEESVSMDSTHSGGQEQTTAPASTPSARVLGSPCNLHYPRSHLRKRFRRYADYRRRRGSGFCPYS